jgi:hypothetical protein
LAIVVQDGDGVVLLMLLLLQQNQRGMQRPLLLLVEHDRPAVHADDEINAKGHEEIAMPFARPVGESHWQRQLLLAILFVAMLFVLIN